MALGYCPGGPRKLYVFYWSVQIKLTEAGGNWSPLIAASLKPLPF